MSKATSKKPVGAPSVWGETKRPVNMTLTSTAITGLDELAEERGLSRSELVERIGRRRLIIMDNVFGIDVTDAALTGLYELAEERGITPAELLERLGRGLLRVESNDEPEINDQNDQNDQLSSDRYQSYAVQALDPPKKVNDQNDQPNLINATNQTQKTSDHSDHSDHCDHSDQQKSDTTDPDDLLTPNAAAGLDYLAQKHGISRSEVIERIELGVNYLGGFLSKEKVEMMSANSGKPVSVWVGELICMQYKLPLAE